MKKLTHSRFLLIAFTIGMLLVTACSPLAEVSLETVGQQGNEETAVVEAPVQVQEPVVSDTEAAVPEQTNPDQEIITQGLAELSAREQALVNLFETVNPAVVNIAIGSGEGSGFVIDAENGYIVTNNHVVAGGGSIVVTFSDGTELPSQIIGTDPASDLAVIQIDAEAKALTAVSLADSDALKVGQTVVAIGSPFGLQSSMTTGIVSGLDRLFPGAISPSGAVYQIPDIIQTDAAVNPGNSGGPLLNLQGQVIGVNTAIESPVRGSSGIGYAIPANIVSNVVPQLIANGQAQHPWLGISGGTLTAQLAQQLGLSETQKGILVREVVAGGPAAEAGLRGGNNPDIIVGIDGETVTDFDDLLGYIVQDTAVGQTVQLQVLRDGQVQTVPLTLLARPADA